MTYKSIVKEVMANVTSKANQEKVPVVRITLGQAMTNVIIHKLVNTGQPNDVIICSHVFTVEHLKESIADMEGAPNPIVVLSGIDKAEPEITAAIINMCKTRKIPCKRGTKPYEVPADMRFILTMYGDDLSLLGGDTFSVYPRPETCAA